MWQEIKEMPIKSCNVNSFSVMILIRTLCIHTYEDWFKSTGLSKKVDGILNRYNLKSTGRIYTIGILKCSEEFKVLDLP